jgi:hypothetical protein
MAYSNNYSTFFDMLRMRTKPINTTLALKFWTDYSVIGVQVHMSLLSQYKSYTRFLKVSRYKVLIIQIKLYYI